ncbi:MAG: hypothetical protein JXX28_01885 [Deltaproteobacteria bacterium]|nr:hypothetical protein [Deltaproteobacteria bacterium]
MTEHAHSLLELTVLFSSGLLGLWVLPWSASELDAVSGAYKSVGALFGALFGALVRWPAHPLRSPELR